VCLCLLRTQTQGHQKRHSNLTLRLEIILRTSDYFFLLSLSLYIYIYLCPSIGLTKDERAVLKTHRHTHFQTLLFLWWCMCGMANPGFTALPGSTVVKHLSSLFHGQPEEQLRTFYNLLDHNRDGYVSSDDVIGTYDHFQNQAIRSGLDFLFHISAIHVRLISLETYFFTTTVQPVLAQKQPLTHRQKLTPSPFFSLIGTRKKFRFEKALYIFSETLSI